MEEELKRRIKQTKEHITLDPVDLNDALEKEQKYKLRCIKNEMGKLEKMVYKKSVELIRYRLDNIEEYISYITWHPIRNQDFQKGILHIFNRGEILNIYENLDLNCLDRILRQYRPSLIIRGLEIKFRKNLVKQQAFLSGNLIIEFE